MRGNRYQTSLIFLGVVVAALFGVFFLRELFPEYKSYQNTYVELEKFRSSYTGEPPPSFEFGIKQVLLERGSGPPIIDRCTSCHVAVQFQHFSPTQIAKDVNGNIRYDSHGVPLKEHNESYVWKKLDEKIDSLISQGKQAEAEKLKSLKTVEVDDHIYDVTKAIQSHPLIGRETRPFEYHPLEEYGCTVCHSGNGRSLVTDRAHGPVYDGQYEEEFMGPEPEFLELDPKNDPPFASVFNHKPGHRLLFQTQPLYVGALMEAKCVQCHQSTTGILEGAAREASLATKMRTEKSNGIEPLLHDFNRGKQLFLSQACYACHRIDGFTRGGVGPELTNAGKLDPWYLKESIVWPQADLRTSTMPNFKLDHDEIEDLLTFLLAQHGRNRTVSEMDYRLDILDWEAGAKRPWEKPINPGMLHDLRDSMTIFASEGCASCHRLKGYESNVGFAIEQEKETKPNFSTLYKEREWFQNLFPENSLGSEIVSNIEKNQEEIDKRIVNGVRTHAILEEIEAAHPELIESFYSPFKYAARAKDAAYTEKAANTADPQQKQDILNRKEAWKDRVHRVLMMYVQEYGLGRLIGPRPNWSGIYRSDEWLIEHFRKPSRHTARSIMPVMPFDDSKFYALTSMLDTLAIKNREEMREVWNQFGFDPEEAYLTLCSQCHGEFLHGNGPVAEWIYPIPKNLRDANFLRNYTKENVIFSITHGVKGTPMPPWGEAADKSAQDNTPVLSKNEISQLVDWLFSSLMGGTGLHNDKDVLKWHYGPEDVILEMKNEKNFLKSNPPSETHSGDPRIGLLNLFSPEEILVSLNSIPPTQSKKEGPGSVEDIFERVPNKFAGEEKNLYYIKKEYYTQENTQKGQEFFELNCAVCHGKEADGQGYRAGTMYDAKPRMLTNLHWLEMRDDLRLLRSIKYGVPGTAMTPWGDLTTSLQRLQLVIYIRSLNVDQMQRDDLFNGLYRSFEEADQTLDSARVEQYKIVNALNEKLKEIQSIKSQSMRAKKGNAISTQEAVTLYQEELELEEQIKAHQQVDNLLIKLKGLVKEEGQIYQSMGINLVSKTSAADLFSDYLNLLKIHEQEFQIVDGKLKVAFDKGKDEKGAQIGAGLIESLKKQLKEQEKKQEIVLGMLPSLDRTKELEQIKAEINSIKKVTKVFSQGFEKTSILRKEQYTTYEQYQNTLNELTKA